MDVTTRIKARGRKMKIWFVTKEEEVILDVLGVTYEKAAMFMPIYRTHDVEIDNKSYIDILIRIKHDFVSSNYNDVAYFYAGYHRDDQIIEEVKRLSLTEELKKEVEK